MNTLVQNLGLKNIIKGVNNVYYQFIMRHNQHHDLKIE